jgi:hypothetical protein
MITGAIHNAFGVTCLGSHLSEAQLAGRISWLYLEIGRIDSFYLLCVVVVGCKINNHQRKIIVTWAAAVIQALLDNLLANLSERFTLSS